MRRLQALIALVFIATIDTSLATDESLLRPGESALRNRRAPVVFGNKTSVIVEPVPGTADHAGTTRPLDAAAEFTLFNHLRSTDAVRARTHLEGSADKGYGLAQFEMGEAFAKGLYGWPVIYATAAKYYKLAIETMRSTGLDHRPAARALVSLYEKGSKDLQKNPFLALKYLMVAEDSSRPGIVTEALESTPDKYLYTGTADPEKYSFKPFEQFMESMKRLPSRKDELSSQGFIRMPLLCLEMCEYMHQVADYLAELKRITTSSPMMVSFITHNMVHFIDPARDKESHAFTTSYIFTTTDNKKYSYVSLSETLHPVLVDYLKFAYAQHDPVTISHAYVPDLLAEIVSLFDGGEQSVPMAIGSPFPSLGRFLAYCKFFDQAYLLSAVAAKGRLMGFKQALQLLEQTNAPCDIQVSAFEEESHRSEECYNFFIGLSNEVNAAFDNVRNAVLVFTPVREKLFKQDPKYKIILDALGIK